MKDWKQLYRTGEQQERYSALTIKHFLHPRNVGRIQDADGVGVMGSPACGDCLEISIRLDASGQQIEQIGFLLFGCPAAVATTSVTTELAKGLTVEKARALCEADVVRALGGLPEVKVHCSLLSVDTLRAALDDGECCRRLIGEGKVRDQREYREMMAERQLVFPSPTQAGGNDGKEKV